MSECLVGSKPEPQVQAEIGSTGTEFGNTPLRKVHVILKICDQISPTTCWPKSSCVPQLHLVHGMSKWYWWVRFTVHAPVLPKADCSLFVLRRSPPCSNLTAFFSAGPRGIMSSDTGGGAGLFVKKGNVLCMQYERLGFVSFRVG